MRVGSLFSGYGGLDLALGHAPAWVVENDPAASRVLARHWPDAPNLGDVTTVDWSAVPPVDVLTGGFPCQDVSEAGLRAGLRHGTRSGLWSAMARAISHLRPQAVLIENVRGLLNARADGDLGPGSGDVGAAVRLRALGRVLGDLSDLRYDAGWVTARASDVGAPHRRERVFILACPADPDGGGWHEHGRAGAVQPARAPAERSGDGARAVSLLPSPVAQPSGRSAGQYLSHLPGLTRIGDLNVLVRHLLPTPVLNDMGANKEIEQWDRWRAEMRAKHGNGNGHGPSLAIEALRLLPTPLSVPESEASHRQVSGRFRAAMDDAISSWGRYAPAIARWEQALGRGAPAPTEPGPARQVLSPRFVEWMMGLPDGWVTGVDGLSRARQLKILGNGVVPQQAAHALWLLTQRVGC